MPKNTTLRERVRAVEVEIQNMREDIRRVVNAGENVTSRLSKLENHVSTLIHKVDEIKKHIPGMSGRDKAAIVISLITSITSIIVIAFQTFA